MKAVCQVLEALGGHGKDHDDEYVLEYFEVKLKCVKISLPVYILNRSLRDKLTRPAARCLLVDRSAYALILYLCSSKHFVSFLKVEGQWWKLDCTAPAPELESPTSRSYLRIRRDSKRSSQSYRRYDLQHRAGVQRGRVRGRPYLQLPLRPQAVPCHRLGCTRPCLTPLLSSSILSCSRRLADSSSC